MFIKKFEATSLEKALELVKSELGPQALVLSTQKKPGNLFNKPRVEVTAAAAAKAREIVNDFDEGELTQIFPHRKIPVVSPKTETKKEPREHRYVDIESRKSTPSQKIGKELNLQRFERDFVDLGISKPMAEDLSRRLVLDYPLRDLSQAEFLRKAKRKVLTSFLTTLSLETLRQKNVWVAVGPPGVGKTSLLVKLAIQLKGESREVQLVGCDRRRITAKVELSHYANLIGVPFFDEPPRVHSKNRIQLIDSPALDRKKPMGSGPWNDLVRDRNVVFVLDASQRLSESLNWIAYAESLDPQAIAFTKVDHIQETGVLFELLRRTRLPLFGISDSAQFRKSFRFLEPTEFAEVILRNSDPQVPVTNTKSIRNILGASEYST